MYQELRRLGLTKYETKMYQALVEYGRLDAKSLSKISGVPPTAVYPNVKSLQEMGLIQHFSGKISAYEAIQPKVALPAFVEREKKKLILLQNNLIQQAENALHKKEIFPQKEVVQVSQGREASTALYSSFAKQTRKSLYILGWHMYKVRDKYEWLRVLQQLVKKGADVRILLIGTLERERGVIQAYQNAGIGMRYIPLENFSLVVRDGQECKITLKARDLPEKINVHIQDKDLSAAMQNYFLMTWEKAEKV